MTALSARFIAVASAVLPVTHPPHPNPAIAKAAAPPATPQKAGFASIGILIAVSFKEDERQAGTISIREVALNLALPSAWRMLMSWGTEGASS
jgi:hypothetical protein